jgi:ribonuclease R
MLATANISTQLDSSTVFRSNFSGASIPTLKKSLLVLLSQDPSKRYGIKQIASRLKVRGKERYHTLLDLIADLEREGVVGADEKGRIGYVVVSRERTHPRWHQGVVRVTRKGYGYVRVEGMDEEMLIAPKFMRTALDGDTVAVAPFARKMPRRQQGENSQPEGEIVKVLHRKNTMLVGTLSIGSRLPFVVPDNPRFTRDVYLAKEDPLIGRDGSKVVVELYPWEDEHRNPEGKIVEVLGPGGDARIEVLSVARAFGLTTSFPPDVDRAADRLSGSISTTDIAHRRDLRSELCCTIDPDDAKDFDDALSLEERGNGILRLGVHIADVSHFVREGTPLDEEARRRGTSVYLVNEVIPMLPERLSNDLCSLRPNVDRLTYSVFMDVDAHGNVVEYAITKSVIHSRRRFTYEEVQDIIQSGKGELAKMILPLHALSRVLSKRRQQMGSIDFETAEAKFTFDETGLPSEIIKKVRVDAHRLVEECMLLANQTVARHIGVRTRPVRPFLFRVHDSPDPSRLKDLAQFVKKFGYSLDVKQGVTTKALQRLLKGVKGSDVEDLINEVTLRAMAKAVYSAENIGHFGLGFKHYAHFTSPIRRYPDLIIHRMLESYERNSPLHQSEDTLPDLARHCSERERNAVEAERASVKVMQAEYMKRHVGDVFDGIIGGVTNFGIFVEVTQLLVEGLVRVRDLDDDYYIFDEKHYLLRGRSRGKIYRLGDAIKVQVVSVNPEQKEINFKITS